MPKKTAPTKKATFKKPQFYKAEYRAPESFRDLEEALAAGKKIQQKVKEAWKPTTHITPVRHHSKYRIQTN